MAEYTDEEIAVKVQNGDGESFGTLVHRYEERLKRYARKFLMSSEESKDLVQEVFMKAYINIKSFDATRKFSSWLYAIAHNEFINAGKKKSKLPLFTFDLDALFPHLSAPETADGESEKREVRALLDASLDKLDVKYRDPLVLYYFEDMDYKEIADILKLPVGTVGIRLTRGKKLLKSIVTTLETHGT